MHPDPDGRKAPVRFADELRAVCLDDFSWGVYTLELFW
jgi:hypothetical protein